MGDYFSTHSRLFDPTCCASNETRGNQQSTPSAGRVRAVAIWGQGGTLGVVGCMCVFSLLLFFFLNFNLFCVYIFFFIVFLLNFKEIYIIFNIFYII